MFNLVISENKQFTFDIDLFPKNLCLFFSGGVESTLLLYILLTEIKKTNHCLTVYILDRPNRPLVHGYNVFSMVKNLVNSDANLETLKIPDVPYFQQLNIATSLIANQHDIIFWGINKYPSDQTIRPNYLFNFIETEKLSLPFKNFEKDEIIKMYYYLKIDHLLPFTHSCGLGTEQPCGKCFNCRERTWAYHRLNISTDLGI
jgi:predicted phosphoadenosine phosphosulfate sulfurtransferase